MRIGIYDPYLDDLGGGEKYMAKIAECFAADHTVTIFWDNQKDIEELLKRFSLDLSKISLSPNIFSPQVGLLKRLWETRKYEAIVFLSDGSLPFSLSSKLFIHFQQPLPFVKVGLKTRFKIARVNKFFCNSYFTKAYIDKEFGVDSLVIYPPIEIKPKKTNKENIILTVGRFRVRDVLTQVDGLITGVGDYKKQTAMIEAFKELVKNGLENWRFVLAVSVKDKEKKSFEALKKETQDFPIDFLVNKTNAELGDIYSRAKIYWHAAGFGENLEKHPEYAEHFGISTVEAMGGGVVPVVFNAGGQREIVKEGKNGFLWETLAELEEITLKLIKDKNFWKKMSEEAKNRAKLFSEERFCKEINKLI